MAEYIKKYGITRVFVTSKAYSLIEEIRNEIFNRTGKKIPRYKLYEWGAKALKEHLDEYIEAIIENS